MSGKRFKIEDGFYAGKSRPLIYDYGARDDDYYFCGDYRDFKSLCKLLNGLHEENQQLQKVIGDNEKLIQSAYNELSKLKTIKNNLIEIKTRWKWIMESVEYE